jgi:hypothetical protein
VRRPLTSINVRGHDHLLGNRHRFARLQLDGAHHHIAKEYS